MASVALTGRAATDVGGTGAAGSPAPSGLSLATQSSTTLSVRQPHHNRSDEARLVPADSFLPVAGICASPHEHIVTVLIQPDTSSPRCTFVRPDQALRVVNRTEASNQPGHPISVGFADQSTVTLAVGEAVVFGEPFGTYLALGVHEVRSSAYGGGSAAEIWLR